MITWHTSNGKRLHGIPKSHAMQDGKWLCKNKMKHHRPSVPSDLKCRNCLEQIALNATNHSR